MADVGVARRRRRRVYADHLLSVKPVHPKYCLPGAFATAAAAARLFVRPSAIICWLVFTPIVPNTLPLDLDREFWLKFIMGFWE